MNVVKLETTTKLYFSISSKIKTYMAHKQTVRQKHGKFSVNSTGSLGDNSYITEQ
jgi:hypothetical protein